MKSDKVTYILFFTIILESFATSTLETNLNDSDQTQVENVPRWFDPATMRIVKKDDTLYLGYFRVFHPLLFSSMHRILHS